MGTVYKDPTTGKLIMVGGWKFSYFYKYDIIGH
jgi:hypothetical protein